MHNNSHQKPLINPIPTPQSLNTKLWEISGKLKKETTFPNQSMNSHNNLSILEGGVIPISSQDTGKLLFAGSNDETTDNQDLSFINKLGSDNSQYNVGEFSSFPSMTLRNSGSGNPWLSINNPTVGILINPHKSLHVYITKRDSDGKLIWANRIDGKNVFISATDMKLDSDDNIYIVGYFLDIGSTGIVFNNAGLAKPEGSLHPISIVPVGFYHPPTGINQYIVKYSPDGMLLNLSIIQNTTSRAIIDNSGTIIFKNNEPTYIFKYPVAPPNLIIFDDAVIPKTFGIITFTNAGSFPSVSKEKITFIMRFNSSLSLVWANKMLRMMNLDVVVDKTDYILTGFFVPETKAIIYSPGLRSPSKSISSKENKSSFLSTKNNGFYIKYDNDGNFKVAAIVPNVNNVVLNNILPNTLVVDRENNSYFIMNLAGNSTLTDATSGFGTFPNAGTLIGVGKKSNVLLKYDYNGLLVWTTFIDNNIIDLGSLVITSRICYLIGDYSNSDNDINIYNAGTRNPEGNINSILAGKFSKTEKSEDRITYLISYSNINGNVFWGTYFNGIGKEVKTYFSGIVKDNLENAFVTLKSEGGNEEVNLNLNNAGKSGNPINVKLARTITHRGSSNIILKINPSGNILWFTTIESRDQKDVNIFRNPNVDSNNNLYVNGGISGKKVFFKSGVSTVLPNTVLEDEGFVEFKSKNSVSWFSKYASGNSEVPISIYYLEKPFLNQKVIHSNTVNLYSVVCNNCQIKYRKHIYKSYTGEAGSLVTLIPKNGIWEIISLTGNIKFE